MTEQGDSGLRHQLSTLPDISRLKMALFVVMLLLCVQNDALAGKNSPGVVLLSLSACCADNAWPAAEMSIIRELALLDISVVRQNATTATELEIGTSLVAAATTHGADAAIVVFIQHSVDEQAVIRIYDRITDKSIIRNWSIHMPPEPDDAMFAGLRMVDTLRASLLEKQMEKQRPPEETAVQGQTIKLTETTDMIAGPPRLVSLGAGVAMAATPGQSPRFGGFETVLGWHPLKSLALAFTVTWYPLGGEVSESRVTSDLDLLTLRGWLIWQLIDQKVTPELYIGGGNLIAFAKGTEGEKRLLKHDVSMIGYGGGGAGVSIRVTSFLRIKIVCRVGITLPEIQLYHASERVTHIGHPLFESGIVAAVRVK